MSHVDQIEHLENDLETIITRYRKEYEMTYAAMIGVFQLKVHQLSAEAYEETEEEE